MIVSVRHYNLININYLILNKIGYNIMLKEGVIMYKNVKKNYYQNSKYNIRKSDFEMCETKEVRLS